MYSKENQGISDVFIGYRNEKLPWKELMAVGKTIPRCD